jgi:O-antigen ligase
VPALFFSLSRSAWLALAGAFGLMIVWLWRQKKPAWNRTFIKLLIIGFLITAILTALFLNLLVSRVVTQTDLEAQSIKLRVAFTKQALTLIKNDWLLGEGLGNYTLAVYEKYNRTWPGYFYQPVHNIYLLVLAELGIFGAAVFLLILLLVFANLRRSPPSLERSIFGLALMLILVISFFDHYFWTLYFGSLVFWLILALNVKQLSHEKNLE